MSEPYAFVRDGQIVKIKHVDVESVPQHKLDVDGGKLLRPFVDLGSPSYEPALEVCSFEDVVSVEQVTREYTVTRRTVTEQKQAVKDESGLRIYTRFPQWKQSNYTVRASELIEKKADGLTLTTEETAELEALREVWTWIKSIRIASNTIENMDPIPLDYRSDSHWPADYSGQL